MGFGELQKSKGQINGNSGNLSVSAKSTKNFFSDQITEVSYPERNYSWSIPMTSLLLCFSGLQFSSFSTTWQQGLEGDDSERQAELSTRVDLSIVKHKQPELFMNTLKQKLYCQPRMLQESHQTECIPLGKVRKGFRDSGGGQNCSAFFNPRTLSSAPS